MFFDEMSSESGTREPYGAYSKWFDKQDTDRLSDKSRDAEAFFRSTGITFNVYGQEDAEERLIPFDLIPRIFSAFSRMRTSIAGAWYIRMAS